jgi:hypothetical protein
MKAIDINGKIKQYSKLPSSWGNVLGGFDLLSDEQLKTYGFYDVVIPEHDSRIHSLTEVYFDTENEVFTQDVIDFTFTETLSEMKAMQINVFKTIVNSELKSTDWYIIRNQETGEAIPADITSSRQALRDQTVTVENEINALSTIQEVRTYDYPEIN